MDDLKAIAVLIDADNTRLAKLESILHELTAHGRIVVKKAYGNWKKPTLKDWESKVNRLAIKTVQQFDYVSGKNATDIVMVIDAMDLLHTERYDAFALVSSDSDFTPLAIRLRESKAYVIGVGENKTPEAFRNSCDDFIFLEYLDAAPAAEPAAPEPAQPEPAKPAVQAKAAKPARRRAAKKEEEKEADAAPNIQEIHSLLKTAYDKYQNEDGYANVSQAGDFIKRAKPDFDPRTYGYSKFLKLINAFPDKYVTKRYQDKERASTVYYQCI